VLTVINNSSKGPEKNYALIYAIIDLKKTGYPNKRTISIANLNEIRIKCPVAINVGRIFNKTKIGN